MLNVSCIIKHQAGKLYLITYCGRFNFCHDTKIWFEKTHNTICYGILLYDYVCTLTAFRHISHLLLLHHAKRQHFSVLRAGTFVPWPCTDCTVPNICLFCRAASVYVCWLACIRRNFGFIFAFRKENRKPACDKFKPVFTSWKQNRFNIFRAIAFVLLSLIFCLLFLILKQNNFYEIIT